MLFRLIATIVLALAVFGIVLLINRYLFGGRLPKWVMPVSIAVSIIGFQVVEEYSWYPRISSKIGDNYVVLQEQRPRQVWRPWSYIWPSVTAVTVMNMANLRNPSDHPELSVGWLTSLSSLGASSDALFALDCSQGRFGPYNEDVSQIAWADMGEEYYSKICDGTESE